MVNYTTQHAQKLTILISKTQKFSGEGAHAPPPSAPRNLAPSALDFRPPGITTFLRLCMHVFGSLNFRTTWYNKNEVTATGICSWQYFSLVCHFICTQLINWFSSYVKTNHTKACITVVACYNATETRAENRHVDFGFQTQQKAAQCISQFGGKV